MTVQNTTVKDIYVGNGATTKFPITFQMTDHPEYIKVYITGDDSVAVETENFSVDLGAKTVTYPANGDPLPDGHKITIYRELPLYQLMNLVNQGPFFAENIELSFDDLTFICQQLNEKLNRTLSAGIDVSNFNNTFPVKAGMSFRINDAGDGLVLTEDPARVLPLAKDVLEQTKQVKESAVNETTNIKNTAIEELTAIKDAAVNETTEIKDEAVAAKNTAVEAATTAAEDAVNNVQTLLDEKVAAAENAKSAAVSSAESALASKNAAAASQSSAAASAETAQASAESASSSANAALASKNAALTSENNAKASETKSAKSEENAKAAETAAENSKKSASDSASAASSSAESALESKTLAAASANSASASKTSAESSAKSAASSATTATEQADRAQDIADSLEGLSGITGIATTEEAIAGESDTKAMTPLKTKEAINAQTQNKADLVDGKVPKDQLPSSVYIPANSNLDLYLETGNYYSPTDLEAATILNAPLKTSFFLYVDQATELNSNQVIIHYPFNGRVFVRLYYAGAWSEWSELGGANIGDIFYRPFLMPGYVKANGATVIRTDYPNLVTYANNNNLWTSDPDIEPWKFGVGDGNTTMILPNYLNRVLQGGDSPAVLAAGLPNIQGTLTGLAYRNNYYGVGTGVFSTSRSGGQSALTLDGVANDLINFNATNSNSIYGASNTVQPPAIVLIPQIKY